MPTDEDLIRVTSNQAKLGQRRGLSISEAANSLGVSPNFLKGQIGQGLLRARRLGRRVIILSEDIEKYLDDAEVVRSTSVQPE